MKKNKLDEYFLKNSKQIIGEIKNYLNNHNVKIENIKAELIGGGNGYSNFYTYLCNSPFSEINSKKENITEYNLKLIFNHDNYRSFQIEVIYNKFNIIEETINSFWGGKNTAIKTVRDWKRFRFYPFDKEERLKFNEILIKEKEKININDDTFYLILDLLKFIGKLEIKYQEKYNSELSVINEKLIPFDSNKDGLVDIINNKEEFLKFLNKNQTKIIEFDKQYIHDFVKLSNFLKIKVTNIQTIFSTIKKEKSIENKEIFFKILKNQIYSYELMLFHSINMIKALTDNELIVFYEIYESFDKLNVFNSNWENSVSNDLKNIDSKLEDLMYSIHNMEEKVVSEIKNLNYITQESYKKLESNVVNELKSINSSINFNNLLTGIQTYQLYKINKSLKPNKKINI